MTTPAELEADARFVVNYFSLPIRAIVHIGPHSKGGLSLVIDASPYKHVGKICRRRWMNSEIRNRCLEMLIAKISRMICHNTGNCDIRVLSGLKFL